MGSSSLFSLGNRLRSAIKTLIQEPIFHRHLPLKHQCHSTSAAPRPSLASTIFPLGHPSISIAPELDRWVDKGNNIRKVEIQNLVRDLRRRRRYRQALEASEWMKDKAEAPFTPADHAVQLDLIGVVRGLSSAEDYFSNLSQNNKNEKTYGALLNCYVRDRLEEKSLAHFQKMKEMGFASSPLPYNDIMCLYTNTGQHKKIPSVLAEMKSNGVLPDNFSYRICINSYGSRSDIEGMENILTEMKHQPQIVVDWNTYSVAANIYIKAGLADKAVSALKKAEEKLDRYNGLCYNHLISLYGNLRNKSEMNRLWLLQKEKLGRFINRDYTTMLGSLVKLGEIEEAEVLLGEWETSGNAFDFRVPNILLIGYRQQGLLEKAEAMLDDFLKKGKKPPSSSWGIVATGYAEKGEMTKAYELMLNALCVYARQDGWEPNTSLVKCILQYLGDEGDPEGVRTFVSLLRNARAMDRDMYHALIKANMRAGGDVDGMLKNMKADGIEENEGTREILSLKSKIAV